MPLPYVYRVTKYDPADRNEHGHYVGTQDIDSDHGTVEAAYLAAVAAFAEDAGVTGLTVRDPELFGSVDFDYYDGVQVTLDRALSLVQRMLRGGGLWCRLEVDDRFFVHIGYDQYMYIGSVEPCERAVGQATSLGLFPERLDISPYDPSWDERVEQRPANDAFWAEVTELAATRGSVLLDEAHVRNSSRWHRVHTGNIGEIRAALTPRARLEVWPDLSVDVTAVLRSLPQELVWEDEDGRITSFMVDDELRSQLPELVANARAAMALTIYAADRQPLLTAVLPDRDGVVRARWSL